MRTDLQIAGDAAEGLVAAALVDAGWTVLGRQVHVGRAEIDIIAIDPRPPRELVVVEVRRRGRRDFGLGEETVDRRKQARLRHAAYRWLEEARPPIARLPLRFDLIVVEPGDVPAAPRIRHHRAAF